MTRQAPGVKKYRDRICERCPVTFTPASGRQKYCKPCARAIDVERSMRWAAANRERSRELKTQWRLDHPEAMTAARTAWREANPGRVRATRRKAKKKNPVANRSYVRARRARKKQQTVIPFTAAALRARLDYFGNRCWMCGGVGEVIEHVKPLSKGGAHALCNIRPACHDCNTRKGTTWPFPTSRS